MFGLCISLSHTHTGLYARLSMYRPSPFCPKLHLLRGWHDAIVSRYGQVRFKACEDEAGARGARGRVKKVAHGEQERAAKWRSVLLPVAGALGGERASNCRHALLGDGGSARIKCGASDFKECSSIRAH